MATSFILTTSPTLQKEAIKEVRDIGLHPQEVKDLQNGRYYVSFEDSRSEVLDIFRISEPVLVKHSMPVDRSVQMYGDKGSCITTILKTLDDIPDKIKAGDLFSVQCRVVAGGSIISAKDVEVGIGKALEEQGAIASFSDTTVRGDPNQQTVSVFIDGNVAYLGLSTVSQNLNEHSDEYRIFSHRPKEVSRAEFKLLEALRKFQIKPAGKIALDLGAAPGGWTKVLADIGFTKVVAVDPGALLDKVTDLPNVEHFRGRAENYHPQEAVDIITNDMNMDPEDSARLMVKMSSKLIEGGLGIMTLKLVVRDYFKLMSKTREILEQNYTVKRAKLLFHNRQEITLLLQKGHPDIQL